MKFIVVTLAIIPFLWIAACRNSRDTELRLAMESDKVIFQPIQGDSIVLSPSQAREVKRIVRNFTDPSAIHFGKEMPGLKYGDFILGAKRFSWQGDMLYYREEREGWWIVESRELTKPSRAYINALGKPPIQIPSPEQWKTIFDLLTEE